MTKMEIETKRVSAHLPELEIGMPLESALHIIANRLDYFKEAFMDFMNQGCGHYDKDTQGYTYDHMCLSTYEDGVRFALRMGWIEQKQVTR